MDQSKYCRAEGEENEENRIQQKILRSSAVKHRELFSSGWVARLSLSIKYHSEENCDRSVMTRKEWQKKKKKMSGREGPKKGKNR